MHIVVVISHGDRDLLPRLNQFLANIREADAICVVTRAFSDPDIVHVEGRVDPKGDIETVTTELILADMQTLEKQVPRLVKEVTGKKTPNKK